MSRHYPRPTTAHMGRPASRRTSPRQPVPPATLPPVVVTIQTDPVPSSSRAVSHTFQIGHVQHAALAPTHPGPSPHVFIYSAALLSLQALECGRECQFSSSRPTTMKQIVVAANWIAHSAPWLGRCSTTASADTPSSP